MAVGKVCRAPASGGSNHGLSKYLMGYALEEKGATPEQKREAKEAYDALIMDVAMRDDLGVGVVIETGRTRPATVYCEGVTSLATFAEECDALAAANGRIENSALHYVLAFDPEESAQISLETKVEYARRVMDKMGFGDHAKLIVGHEDVAHGHVHVQVAAVNSRTLKAHPAPFDYKTLHKMQREVELEMGLQHGRGAWVIDEKTNEIRLASAAEKEAWKREAAIERLESLARSAVSDSDGLESYEDRRDQVEREIRQYLDACEERGEKPLRADLHRIAAERFCTLEQGLDGALRVRMMERAAEGAGRDVVDDFGDQKRLLAKWTPTDVAYDLPLSDLAPSPYDDPVFGENGGPDAFEKHAAATERRAFLADLGDVERSERECIDLVKQDPGRISRDQIAGGNATFTSADFDRWIGDRVTDYDVLRELSDYAQKNDDTLHVVTTQTNFIEYTTKEHRAREQQLHDIVEKLAQEEDALFDRDAMQRAITDEEKAQGFTFSDEQKSIFWRMNKRIVIVQGDAGVGKTVMMSVAKRYAEYCNREIGGYTTAQLAAEKLGAETGIGSVNTALAATREKYTGAEMIKRESLSIFDEGSMISMRTMADGLQKVDAAGGIAIVQGDEAQLPNIEAGDTFRACTRAARKHDQLAYVTTVFRQSKGPDVSWMAAQKDADGKFIPGSGAVAKGGKAIRDGDVRAAQAYFQEFVDRGHVVFHGTKKEQVMAQAADMADFTRDGHRVIMMNGDRKTNLFVNREVRRLLGRGDEGQAFKFDAGVRQIAAGDRVIFTKNANKQSAVIDTTVRNGYTGTVRGVEMDERTKRWQITVELDDGRSVAFDPEKYKHLDYGWAVTVHKAQGQGDPIALPGIGKGDDARKAHVAVTRALVGLRVHTTIPEKDFAKTIARRLQPKTVSLYVEEIIRRNGGPETQFAKAFERAMREEKDPIRQAHRADVAKADSLKQRLAKPIHNRYAEALREAKQIEDPKARKAAHLAATSRHEREIDAMLKELPSKNFVEWAAANQERIKRIMEADERLKREAHRREADKSRGVQQTKAPELPAHVRAALQQANKDLTRERTRGRGR